MDKATDDTVSTRPHPPVGTETPTPHDIARALAAQLAPQAAPRDVVAHFNARRHADIRYRDRSSGGPVLGIARSLHAHLYGLPADPDPLPAALDELLQATFSTGAEEQTAVLARLGEQLRNASEILRWAQHHAHWQQLPHSVFDQLRSAADAIEHIADGLDHTGPAFTANPTRTLRHTPEGGPPNTLPTSPAKGQRPARRPR